MTRRVHSLLLVDDDPTLLRGWRSQLRTRHVEVLLATDRAESVAHVQRRSIDLAIVDQRLGEERGTDVIASVLALQPTIGAVLTSAELKSHDIWEAGRLGVMYVEKPYDIVAVIDLLEAGAELPAPEPIPLHRPLDQVVTSQIARVLRSRDNNVSEAAGILGISRRGLQKNLRKHGVLPSASESRFAPRRLSTQPRRDVETEPRKAETSE